VGPVYPRNPVGPVVPWRPPFPVNPRGPRAPTDPANPVGPVTYKIVKDDMYINNKTNIYLYDYIFVLIFYKLMNNINSLLLIYNFD
jgi:hypothetical protein